LLFTAVQTQPSWDGSAVSGLSVAQVPFNTITHHQSQDVERTVLCTCTMLSCVHATNRWTANFPWFVTHVWNLCGVVSGVLSYVFNGTGHDIESAPLIRSMNWCLRAVRCNQPATCTARATYGSLKMIYCRQCGNLFAAILVT
jgi:hypothetical protein